MAPQPVGTKKVPAKTAQSRAQQLNKKPVNTVNSAQPIKKPALTPIGAKKPLPTAAKKPLPTAAKKAPVTTIAKKTTANTAKALQPVKKATTPIGAKKALPKAVNAIAKPQQPQGIIGRTLSTAASGVSNFAGGVVSAVGNGVAGAGKGAGASITNQSRTWGDMVREYGNSIKDVSGAVGSRAPTGTNPLGLNTGEAGGKASMAMRKGVTPSKTRTGNASNPLGL